MRKRYSLLNVDVDVDISSLAVSSDLHKAVLSTSSVSFSFLGESQPLNISLF